VDSSLGYIPENIEFVTHSVNSGRANLKNKPRGVGK